MNGPCPGPRAPSVRFDSRPRRLVAALFESVNELSQLGHVHRFLGHSRAALVFAGGRGARGCPLVVLLDPLAVAIEGPHALLAARLYYVDEMAECPGADGAPGAGASQQQLAARHSQAAVAQVIKALAQNAHQTIGQLSANAALNVRGK